MKSERQNRILEIINGRAMCTQHELLAALEKAGIKATQATVSRDIRELGIVKEHDKNGGYRYVSGGNPAPDTEINYREVLANSVLRVYHALNDVVVRCRSGMAQGACTVIDKLFSELALGTLAGDDTILAVTRSENEAAALTKKIEEML